MYLVKRPFKNYGTVYTAGTVITEPATIKRFKGKLAEGKIIVVTEQNYKVTAKYFKDKYHVEIPPMSDKPVDTDATKVEEPENATKVTTDKPVKAKVSVSVK